ncbi:orotidine-5'-phosphate decarboxylase [Actinomyces bowdenii]|uniref:orotidine-5'-phosphate decarboxylase n=1 Tax=Actinomyces bowdenii TaxID=131109 RepID=UPI0027D47A5C|nr:orotidine-5'-phosphate decarboxylase [Actinomyces bowdenii]
MTPDAPSSASSAPVSPHPGPPFGERLAAAMEEHGPLCVGIDPHEGLLHTWGLAGTPAGLRDFALRTVEAVGGRVAAVKPQSAFFERHGSAGIAVLEEVLEALRQCGTLSILDVKRGDIGSTMAGYAQAYLAPGAPLAADAITVSPYLGYGSLAPALELAAANRRGVFVLALTSNPQGASIQHARGEDGLAVARGIVEGVAATNAAQWEQSRGSAPDGGQGRGMGSVGLVVGATVGRAVTELGIDLQATAGPLLAPGVGAQGAGARELEEVFGPARPQVLASTSRAVLGAGPRIDRLRSAARQATAQAAQALRPGRL